MIEDEGVIFSNLPRGRGDDDDEERRARSRAWMKLRNANQEGPLRPRPSGVGGPSINQGTAPVTTSVWSASDAAANGMTLSNGGLTVTTVSSAYGTIRGTNPQTSGKFYVEFKSGFTGNNPNDPGFGLANSAFSPVGYLGQTPTSIGLIAGGTATNFANPTTGFTTNYTTGIYPGINDVWALAVDLTAGKIWLALNNVWFGSSSPGTGTLPMATFTGALLGLPYFPAITARNSAGTPVWTLQPTAASQTYAPPAEFSAWDGGAPAHSAQALAYLARTVGGNEGGNATNIANLIDGLVADGVWAKLDALYVLAQQNATDALLNLVGTNYGLTSVGLLRSVTFTSYVGFGGFQATIYLDTGLDPSVAPTPHYTTNDASFGIWSYQILSSVNSQGGRSDSTAIYNKFSDGNFIASVNGAGFPRTPTLITKGLFSTERRDSANVYPYQNGVSAGAIVNASGADTGNFEIGHIGAPTSPNYTDQTLCAAFIGASLGSAGQLALYNRLRTYMSSVGVP